MSAWSLTGDDDDASISAAQRDAQREIVGGGDSAAALQARITATRNPFAAVGGLLGGSVP